MLAASADSPPLEESPSQRHARLYAEYQEIGHRLVSGSAASRDASESFDRSLWRAVGATGLFGLHVPESLGGRGWSLADAASAFEGFAAGGEDIGFLVSMVSHMALVMTALQVFGSAEQQRRWLPGLLDGTLIGCFAVTEHLCGSDVQAMGLRAIPDTCGGWRLDGGKWCITNAPVADVAIVFARLHGRAGHPVCAFLADLHQPGVTRQPRDLMGNRTTPVGGLNFTGFPLAGDALLGQSGRGLRVLDFAFVVERIMTGIAAGGCLGLLTELCAARMEEREAFGKPIGEYQHLQAHVVKMAAGRELVRCTARSALQALERGDNCSLAASVVKMTAADVFQEAATAALRIFGNHGYSRGGTIGRFYRDAAGILLAGGTGEIHQMIIWRELVRMRRRSGKARRRE